MEINKEVTITLTPEEVKEIIKNYLSDRDYNIDKIIFKVDTIPDNGDELGGYSSYQLSKVICEGKM